MKTKITLFLITFFTIFSVQSQGVIEFKGNGKLIADFISTGEKPNVQGQYMEKYMTLVSLIEGTNTVKCMVRVANTVNVIGVWEMNDLNDVQVLIYEVVLENGITDILMIGLTDKKAIQMNLFRLNGEDLIDLGYNYIEQKTAGDKMTVTVEANRVVLIYDDGTEKPYFGLKDGAFTELGIEE